MNRLRRALLASLTVLTLTACTESETTMATMTDTAAKDIVQRYAQETLDLSGWSGFSETRFSPMPCDQTAQAMQGTYQLMVPVAQQPGVLDRVRAGWEAAGYTITAQRTFPDDSGGSGGGGGEVKATNPKDGTQLRLTTGEPPAVRLLIHTACYQPAS
jgi:hypothetical protein